MKILQNQNATRGLTCFYKKNIQFQFGALTLC